MEENKPYDCGIESLKVPLDAVEWRPEFKEALENLILTIHCLVVHTYQLSRWIFVFEPRLTPNFNHGRFMDAMFFYYVFMALVDYAPPEDFFDKKTDDDNKKTDNDKSTDEYVPPEDFFDKKPNEQPQKGKRDKGKESDRGETGDSPTAQPRKGRSEKASTAEFKELIAKHIYNYCASAQFFPETYKPMSSIARYVKDEIATAYAVNIKQRFGQRLRYAINSSLRTHQRVKEMYETMKFHSDSEIRAKCEEQIWAPARAIKEAVQSRTPLCHVYDSNGNPMVKNGKYVIDEDKQRVVDEPAQVLRSYDKDYTFMSDNMYYDIKARPSEHLRAFSRLCQLIETRNQGVRKKKGRNKKANSVQCFPLRTSFVPCHMRINAEIIRQHILPREKGLSTLDPMDIWRRVVNLDAKPFHKRGNKEFSGSASTDGVSISLTFKTPEVMERKHKRAAKGVATKAANRNADDGDNSDGDSDSDDDDDGVAAANDGTVGNFTVGSGPSPADVEGGFVAIAVDTVADVGTNASTAGSGAKKKSTDDCQYVNDLSREELESYKGRNIFDDMGRRDEHYFMHEKSTPENPVVLRYTYCQESKERRTRKFHKICNKARRDYPDNAIQKAENRLAKYDRTSLVPEKFKAYVEARAREGPLLSEFYRKTPTKHAESSHQIHKHQDYTPKTYPLHRKLNLSAYINKQQADHRLVKSIREKFSLPLKPDESGELTILGEPGEPSIKRGDPRADPVVNVGNWSASMVKYQEPIRGKSWRAMLKRNGLLVFLVNEFRTSSVCPECNWPLEKFLSVRNPRPFQRKKRPKVLCHGLLRCTNQNCLKTVADDTDMDVDSTEAKEADAAKKTAKKADKAEEADKDSTSRKYNRNLAAVLNFRKIVASLRETGDILEQFKRENSKDIVAKDKPRDSDAATASTSTAGAAKKKPMRKRPPSKRLKKA
ncbi:hypothetical protein H4R27_003455 [Coemansia aciculifera]|nr:hypothetical protein H4R27_003455 [Coemansia aciculifera]